MQIEPQAREMIGVQEVEPSDVAADIDARNALHPRHQAGMFSKSRCMIITFHDDTFDCVFGEVAVSHLKGEEQ